MHIVASKGIWKCHPQNVSHFVQASVCWLYLQHISLIGPWEMWKYIIKTHVHGFFDTDLHEASCHFAKFNWPSEDQCQRTHSNWVFVFITHLKSKYSHLILSKLSRKSAICPRRPPWLLIVLVLSLRSARLDIAWLVKSMTYFDLIGEVNVCGRWVKNTAFPYPPPNFTVTSVKLILLIHILSLPVKLVNWVNATELLWW